MTEIIVLFHKDDLQNPILADRDEVYTNRRETYKEYYVHVIDMFIFNTYGEVLVQKRSKKKKNMPGLYHSSVGGHINDGDSPQLTLIKECLEEVGAPCILIEDQQEFEHAYKQIGAYTSSFVLAYAHEMMEHVVDVHADRAGRTVHIQDIIYMCFGLYSGPLQNIDRSADGFEWFTLDDLKATLTSIPAAFTPSYPFLFEKLEYAMRGFVEKYCQG